MATVARRARGHDQLGAWKSTTTIRATGVAKGLPVGAARASATRVVEPQAAARHVHRTPGEDVLRLAINAHGQHRNTLLVDGERDRPLRISSDQRARLCNPGEGKQGDECDQENQTSHIQKTLWDVRSDVRCLVTRDMLLSYGGN